MKILHLEDNPTDAALVLDFLREEWPDCETLVAATGDECLRAMQQGRFDLILSDYSLVSFSGLDGLRLARQYQPDVPFIFFSGTISEETAIEAMRDGASDYVLKDRPQRLVVAVRLTLQKRADRERQRRADTQIREQSELLDMARDAIVVTNRDHRIVTWNQGAARLFGWTAAEAVGRPVAELLGAEGFVAPAGANGDDWRREVTAVGKHGNSVMLDMHVTVARDALGAVKAWISISTDITEKHQLQEQFFRAQRLESLGMLASGIAHDLNNILAPSLLAPALLRPRMVDPNDLKLLNVLETSAKKGSELVRQILGFAQGSVGQHQPLQVRHLVREIVNLLQHSLPDGIELSYAITDDIWTITGSPTQIHQILLNLCINARDAMPDGGTLAIRARNAVLREAAEVPEGGHTGEWIVLEVEDTGTGIPPAILAKIWDPFFTTKPLGKGTGLGLSTVRGIVEAHEGFVVVTTAPGKGTRFSIFFPRERSPAA